MKKNKLKKKKKSVKKAGLPPGTLVYVGDRENQQSQIELISYDDSTQAQETIENLNFDKKINPQQKHWVNVTEVSDVNTIKTLGDFFTIDPMILEDVLNTNHRPKIDYYDNSLFVVLKMLSFDEQNDCIASEHISVLWQNNTVITFQEKPGDVFNPVRERLQNPKTKIRQNAASYLFYALIDCVVDHHFQLIDILEDKTEELEQLIFESPDQSVMNRINILKKELIILKKNIKPIQELLTELTDEWPVLLPQDLQKYFYDILDHIKSIHESLDSFRDVINHLAEMYISHQGLRMNQVMQMLTIVATIFIPLTFIAGIYGMNFEWMPELKVKWAYPAVWGVMIFTAAGFIYYFKKKKWL